MALRLLFFLPSHADAVDIHHELTTRLSQELSDKAEVRLVTSLDKGVLSSIADNDIVHIFGCWSNSACTLASKAYSARVPYVLTPLGGLQPWEMERNHSSLLRHKQKRLTERASAVHLCGKLEQETFAKLAWNKNTCIIKNPVLTSQTTFGQTADALLSLYRKVLDSNARLRINADEQKLIGRLIQCGIDDKPELFIEDMDDFKAKISALTAEEWRMLAIYSYEERIDSWIKAALGKLGMAYDDIDVESIDRFGGLGRYVAGELKGDILLTKSLLARNKAKEVFPDYGKVEQCVCRSFLNLYYEIAHRTAPLQHLGDLYRIMRFTDMDEDNVRDMLRQLKMDDFAQRLMAVMDDFLGLTEGFMIFPERKDRKTNNIYKNITKFGTYKQK